MRIAIYVAVFSFSLGSAHAAKPVIEVCLDRGNAALWPTLQAQQIATQIYAGIGVDLEWRHGKHDCNASIERVIHIQFIAHVPEFKFPGALALTHLGVVPRRIDVYYDRVQEAVEPRVASTLLGHVLAHEIAHAIEGLNRHSAEGVMKPTWYSADYHEMSYRPLTFTPQDIDLIRDRLEKGTITLAARRKP